MDAVGTLFEQSTKLVYYLGLGIYFCEYQGENVLICEYVNVLMRESFLRQPNFQFSTFNFQLSCFRVEGVGGEAVDNGLHKGGELVGIAFGID